MHDPRPESKGGGEQWRSAELRRRRPPRRARRGKRRAPAKGNGTSRDPDLWVGRLQHRPPSFFEKCPRTVWIWRSEHQPRGQQPLPSAACQAHGGPRVAHPPAPRNQARPAGSSPGLGNRFRPAPTGRSRDCGGRLHPGQDAVPADKRARVPPGCGSRCIEGMDGGSAADQRPDPRRSRGDIRECATRTRPLRSDPRLRTRTRRSRTPVKGSASRGTRGPGPRDPARARPP